MSLSDQESISPTAQQIKDPFTDLRTDTTSHLHMSDVECRGETIYFAVVDRFNSGKKDRLGKETPLDDHTHTDWLKYWGGDLQGVIDKIDYLQDLGVTALWLTPLFEQVEGTAGESAPIHGYWTQDFKRVNARWVNHQQEVRLFAENTVLDTLIAELHKRRMKFILDIVCNHSSPATTKGKGRLFDDGKLIADFDDDKNNWYHHYGDVKDWNDAWQIQNCELCGLATFNENNLDYRRYIMDSIKMWLDKGVDALRVDTVKHMPNWFWQEFTSEMHTAKPNVFIFGEWIHNHPADPVSVDFANHSGMTVFDFGLCQAIRACFAGNAEQGFHLVQEVLDQDGVYRNASELVTFYENHDMPRLQSMGASNEMLDLATCLVMTTRGIPCLYYGYEQYLHNDTDGGQDPYNRPMMEKWETDTPAFHITRRLSAERGKNPAIQWGGLWFKFVEKDIYVYVRKYQLSRCVVILNKGPEHVFESLDTELPDGTHQCILTGEPVEIKDGKLTGFKIGAAQCRVFSFVGPRVEGKTIARLQLNGVTTRPGDSVFVIGDCPELGQWDISKGVPLEYINPNTWFTELYFNESAGQSVAYKFVTIHPEENSAPTRENRPARRRAVGTEGTAKWRDVWEE
jgi:cyclomaltodextrin glucanotransferase